MFHHISCIFRIMNSEKLLKEIKFLILSRVSSSLENLDSMQQISARKWDMTISTISRLGYMESTYLATSKICLMQDFTLRKTMKEVNLLHDDIPIPRANNQPSIFELILPIYFTLMIQACRTVPIISILRCIWHVLNIIIFNSTFVSDALSKRPRLCTQHLKWLMLCTQSIDIKLNSFEDIQHDWCTGTLPDTGFFLF